MRFSTQWAVWAIFSGLLGINAAIRDYSGTPFWMVGFLSLFLVAHYAKKEREEQDRERADR